LHRVFNVDTIKPAEITFDPAKNAANIRERGLPFSLVKDEFDWSGAQYRRSRIPSWVETNSLMSSPSIAESSSLVTILSGTYEPVPVITASRIWPLNSRFQSEVKPSFREPPAETR